MNETAQSHLTWELLGGNRRDAISPMEALHGGGHLGGRQDQHPPAVERCLELQPDRTRTQQGSSLPFSVVL